MEGIPQNQLILTVKLQFKEYEEGEFSQIAARSAEETIRLITDYPWEEQRDHLTIGLTNPSVTIEGNNGDFLKLSPWYNGKFVLHYFDKHRHLYTRSFDRLPDTWPFIRPFFSTAPFEPDGFKKEITWLQSNSDHFQTREFYYSLKPSAFTNLALFAAWALFLIVNFALLIRFSRFAALPLIAFLILLTRIAALAANHYRAAKGRLLALSRGKDEFRFGPAEQLTTFYKKDIREINTYGRRARGGYPRLTKVELLFTDGRSLDISCLLIRQEILVAKFPHCTKTVTARSFPFITPASATPSG
jgi:hypothetical protein